MPPPMHNSIVIGGVRFEDVTIEDDTINLPAYDAPARRNN
jgi:hypothetical protein